MLASSVQSSAARNDLAWENLKHVTRYRTYQFLLKDSTCVKGRIASVNSDSVSVTVSANDKRKLNREELLSITDVPTFVFPSYLIYQGRSSWADVGTYASNHPESITVITIAGTDHTGAFVKTSDVDLAMSVGGKNIIIVKNQIKTIDLTTGTPLSDREEHWVRECAFPVICALRVSLWPRMLGKGARLQVRLYDASQPEDNRYMVCSGQP